MVSSCVFFFFRRSEARRAKAASRPAQWMASRLGLLTGLTPRPFLLRLDRSARLPAEVQRPRRGLPRLAAGRQSRRNLASAGKTWQG